MLLLVSIQLTVSIQSNNTETSWAGTLSVFFPAGLFLRYQRASSGSRLLPTPSSSVLLVKITLKHVGGAADESGERTAQQDHHTAGTRPENIGTVIQANS